MKIRPLGDELFHAGGRSNEQTDLDEASSRFSKFFERV